MVGCYLDNEKGMQKSSNCVFLRMIEIKGKVFIISAPSGAGKTTLVNALLARYDCFAFSVSATTRPPRAHEVHGQHYYFLEEADFRTRIAENAFLEYEEVYPGRFYGTLRTEVDRIMRMGYYPIFDVDVVGGLNIKEQFGDHAVSIFIQPPSKEVLKSRLQNRDTDSPEEIERRYQKSAHELTYASDYDIVVVNDKLEVAIAELVDIVEAHLV